VHSEQRLNHFLRKDPGRPALYGLAEGADSESDTQVASRAELAVYCQEVGSLLCRSGIDRHARVAFVVPQQFGAAAPLLALMQCAIAVPMHWMWTEAEYERVFRRLQVTGLIVSDINHTAASVARRQGLGIFRIKLSGGIQAAASSAQLLPQISCLETNQTEDKRDAPAWAHNDQLALILQTSGTTAEPKYVPVTHTQLVARAYNLARYLDLDESDRCLSLMPLAHAHGIYDGLLAPLLAGGSTCCDNFLDPQRTFELLSTKAITWITAGFAIHAALASSAQSQPTPPNAPGLRLIRSGSGALLDSVATDLEAIFKVPMVVTYALTEAGVVAASPVEMGGSRLPRVGSWLKNNVRIGESGSAVSEFDDLGVIELRGEHIADGYILADDSGPAAHSSGAAISDRWLNTGDLASLQADGRLRLLGRSADTINRGGQKVAPQEVDARLLAHPEVAEACAFGIPHPRLGQEIAAAVVLKQEADLTVAQLRLFAAQGLATYKIPRLITFVADLPRNANGKLLRRELAQRLGFDKHLPQSSDQSAAMNPTEQAVMQIWSNLLNKESINIDEDFFLLGGDSLSAVEMFAQIERHFGKSLPYGALLEASTIREFAGLLSEPRTQSCLVTLHLGDRRPPLVFIHPSGGQVLGYHTLVTLLPQNQTVLAFQSLGLDGKHNPLGDMDAMANRYVTELLQVQPSGPFQLAGYSFGGRIALLMANRLRSAGHEVSLLALLDTYSFMGPQHLAKRTQQDWLGRIRMSARRHFVRRPYQWLSAFYRQRGWLMPRWLINPRLSNILARRTFNPQPFDGDAILFRGKLAENIHPDMHDRWSELILGKLDVVDIHCKHSEVLKKPAVDIIGSRLVRALRTHAQ